MSIQLQPPVPLVSLVKTEPLTVIKNESSGEALQKEISPDIKDIDIVYHSLSENLIKSETVPENIFETKYSESVETEDTSDKNTTKKHKDTKDIQWFQCNLPEMKFKLKSKLTQPMKVHLKHKQMKDRLDLGGKRQLQPSVPLVTLVKTEPPTVTKNEPPEEALEKEINPDIKHVDIVYHSLSEDLIKSETALENIHDTKYSESVETEVLVKTEDTSDENVTSGTDQEVIEVQGSPEHSNTLSNLETHKQLILNSSNGTTSWEKEKEKEKIKIIRACDIPVESHEYTSLAEDEHICNHCQQTRNNLNNLKFHIKRMHREVTTMYQCPYCSYKSKWSVRLHIIQKHKDPKDIQWFQCNLCEMKFKLKYSLTQHKKVHLKHEQMRDGLDLKRYSCKKCNYKTYKHQNLTKHKITHLKPKGIEYFHCYHCSYKSTQKGHLKAHIFRHYINKDVPFHCYICDFVTPKRDLIIEHIRKHFKNRNKYDETISKYQLESRINNLEKRFPNNLEDYYSTFHFDDHVNHIKKQKSDQPGSTKSLVSRTESVPENSSKRWTFQCIYCPTKFPKEHLLKGHLQLHSIAKGIKVSDLHLQTQ